MLLYMNLADSWRSKTPTNKPFGRPVLIYSDRIKNTKKKQKRDGPRSQSRG